MAKIPKGWGVHKWMSFAKDYGIGFIDSAKEINKGAATGKLAGQFNTSGRGIDVDTGNYIQQHINLLSYIKAEMSEIVGITPQRQGATTSSETLGGVERSVIQSSNNTEWWFKKHESVKVRALTIFLETAKIALRGNKMKLQNILDDFSAEVFELDGDEFSELDYDIFVSAESKAKEMEQTLNQFAHAFMQNGGSLSVVMDILFSESMSDKKRRIELAEFERGQIEQQQAQQQMQIQQEQLQAASIEKDKERELALYTIDANNATKLLVAQMQQDTTNKQIDSNTELSKDEIMLRIKELQSEMEQHKDKMKVERSKPSKK
jgi:hypothetical protein